MKRRYCILVLPCPVRFGGISSVCMLAAMTVFGSAAYFFSLLSCVLQEVAALILN